MSSALPIESPAVRPLRARGRLRALPLKVVAAVAALGIAGFAIGYLGTWPPVATVMSGSMAPTIGTGDMVLFKRFAGRPHVGDVVAVTVPDEARARYGYPPQVIHRVVRIAANGAITTKGDAKPTPDPFTVPASSVHTKVLFAIPAAGRVVAFLSSPMGLLWLAAGGVMLVGLPLLERRQAAEQAEQDALAAVREELHAISEEITRIRMEPVQVAPAPAEIDPMPPETDVTAMPAVDWTDLETTPDPVLSEPWPEPPEFLPGYVPVGNEAPPAPESEPEPQPVAAAEPVAVTYVVRRRSGGLLGRLR